MQKFDTSSLSLRNLRLLIEIFDAGSVSEGASRMELTQSSASHALAKAALKNGLMPKIANKTDKGEQS